MADQHHEQLDSEQERLHQVGEELAEQPENIDELLDLYTDRVEGLQSRSRQISREII